MAKSKGPSTAEVNTIRKRVEKKIVKASDRNLYQRFLVYGHPDSGKTRLVSTLKGVLLLDINDEGTDSVRRDIDPNVLPIDTWDEFIEAYWYLRSGNHKWQAYAVDGLTGLQTLCMNYVLGEATLLDSSRDPDMPSRQIYGKVNKLMKTWITNYRGLPMTGAFTALVRTDGGEEDDDGDMVELMSGPALSPGVQGHALAAVQTVGFLQKREVYVKVKKGGKKKKVIRRRLIVATAKRYHTKDRNGLFGTYVDAPDLQEMLDTIKGGK